MSTASMPTGPLPKHLKATYLASGEYLLEETRATKLFYFPGPIVWLLITGLLTLFSAAAYYGWSGLEISALSNAYATLGSWIHVSTSNVELGATLLFLVLFLLGLLRLAVRYVRWIRTVYAVTNRRVIVQRGVLGRNFDEIPVTQVRGVDVRQTVLQRMLGYGTVRVSSEGGTRVGNEDWVGIPNPFKFQKLIENATIGATSSTPPAQPPWPAQPGR